MIDVAFNIASRIIPFIEHTHKSLSFVFNSNPVTEAVKFDPKKTEFLINIILVYDSVWIWVSTAYINV